MKQFLIFANSNYYPEGGWHDFQGSAATQSEAVLMVANLPSLDWWHIVDTQTGKICAHGTRENTSLSPRAIT